MPSIVNKYINKYPEIHLICDRWALGEIRFKKFKPGNYFKGWHCEHSKDTPYRILAMMIYLSDHNCGTEFYDKSIVKSEKGKAVLFPAHFTHMHRGQKCPDNKSRYILGGYFNLL